MYSSNSQCGKVWVKIKWGVEQVCLHLWCICDNGWLIWIDLSWMFWKYFQYLTCVWEITVCWSVNRLLIFNFQDVNSLWRNAFFPFQNAVLLIKFILAAMIPDMPKKVAISYRKVESPADCCYPEWLILNSDTNSWLQSDDTDSMRKIIPPQICSIFQWN